MLFVGFCFFVCFFFNNTDLAPLPGAFWLLTRKQCSEAMLRQQERAGRRAARSGPAAARRGMHRPAEGGPARSAGQGRPDPNLPCSTRAGSPARCSATQLAVALKSCFTAVNAVAINL